MITEREWRKNRIRARRRRPACCGAQCVFSRAHPLVRDRAFHAFLLFLALTVALLLPVFSSPKAPVETTALPALAAAETAAQPRSVPEITYTMPEGLDLVWHAFTREQLLGGKLLLVDESHPLPDDLPAPNTQGIAVYGRGMVPIHSLRLQSATETIDALASLFAQLKEQGAMGFSVWSATMSPAQQRQARLSCMRTAAARLSLQEAATLAVSQTDTPGEGETRLAYTVELRCAQSGTSLPSDVPLEASPEGQALLRAAWRHGFIRRYPDGEGALAYRFRYVGQAHATAMTYLDVSLEEYVEWLHLKGTLTVEADGKPAYVILCRAMQGDHVAFDLPAGAIWDASLDNAGYAVVACTLP